MPGGNRRSYLLIRSFRNKVKSKEDINLVKKENTELNVLNMLIQAYNLVENSITTDSFLKIIFYLLK